MLVKVGDEYPVRYRSVDNDRELVSATLTLTVTDPSGNASSPTVSNPSLGIYEAAIDVDEAGFWSYRWVATDPYDDVDDGAFTAASVVAPDYISLTLFKSNLKATATAHEELMQLAISTASRKVDEHCYRRFWLDPTATVREYNPDGRTVAISQSGYPSEKLLVDDIASTTGLTVQVGYGSTWTTIDSATYDFAPDNALADFKPIEGIVRRGASWTTHPRQRIRVTARHGWPSIPLAVKQATLIQATRYYLRKDSPEGVMGTAEWGLIRMSKVDPDVAELLKDLVKIGAGSTG
jgi:hypothetical protein